MASHTMPIILDCCCRRHGKSCNRIDERLLGTKAISGWGRSGSSHTRLLGLMHIGSVFCFLKLRRIPEAGPMCLVGHYDAVPGHTWIWLIVYYINSKYFIVKTGPMGLVGHYDAVPGHTWIWLNVYC